MQDTETTIQKSARRKLGAVIALATLAAGAVILARPVEEDSVPAGTVLCLRLDTAASTASSHLHAPVSAHVVRDVITTKGVAIPLGAIVSGRIEKLIPPADTSDRAKLQLSFTRLELPSNPPSDISGHVRAVENSRETVQENGVIVGVLASELPVSRLDAALAKLGGDAQKIGQQTLGQADTSIALPAGVDFEFVLDKPLPVARVFPPAVPHTLQGDVERAIENALAEAPLRCSSKDGKPGDPLNLVVIGTPGQVREAFTKAGWSEAAQKDSSTILETVRAVMGDTGYGKAPVSQLYLYGHAEDFAFEKMFNTFTKRHHLRLWRFPTPAPDGRAIWLGAATHDTGIDLHPGVVSHAIDPDLDAERSKVEADLAAGGHVKAAALVSRPNPLSSGLTATGATWKTDGRLAVLDLRAD